MLKSTCKQFLFLYCIFVQIEFCFVSHVFRLSAKGLFVKKMHVLNKGIVHMIDDIFWNCGFRTESQGEQVVLWLLRLLCFLRLLLLLRLLKLFWKVRVDLGLPDHIWVDKRAAIAKKVDDLGDQFRPAMRTGWLAYIKKTYSADAVQHSPALGQGEWVVRDDEWLLVGPGLFCTLNTQPNGDSAFQNNHNNSSNNRNNRQ